MLREFDNEKQFLKYINKQKGSFINAGSEGDVYHSKDGKIVKIMHHLYDDKYYSEDMITEDKLKLDSYLFPSDIYVSNGIVLGYKQDYFDGDLINVYPRKRLDIDALIKAREKFIEDTKALTDYGYKLFELPRNIMFDNKRLVAIDTLDYIKEKVSLDYNISVIDYAILLELNEIYGDIDVHSTFDKEMEKSYTRIK